MLSNLYTIITARPNPNFIFQDRSTTWLKLSNRTKKRKLASSSSIHGQFCDKAICIMTRTIYFHLVHQWPEQYIPTWINHGLMFHMKKVFMINWNEWVPCCMIWSLRLHLWLSKTLLQYFIQSSEITDLFWTSSAKRSHLFHKFYKST